MSENSIKRGSKSEIVAVVNDNTGKHIYVVKDHYTSFPGTYVVDSIEVTLQDWSLENIIVTFEGYTHYLKGNHYSVVKYTK